MSTITIVTDDVLTRLFDARPQRYGSAETDREIERAFGLFYPPAEILRQAIDAVFWASLSVEENKPALARIEFTDIRDPYCRLEPRAISAAALQKLSPLMDDPSNLLYVDSSANIVGVGQSRRGVSVVAHRRGHLRVLDGRVVLGVFDLGNWVIVGGDEVNLSQILQRALPQESFPERFLKATLILRLAMTARRSGRGATFVLCRLIVEMGSAPLHTR
jgi:hypothetical protein